MAIEAPASKHTQNTFKIFIAVCIGLAIWCAYDGYYNDEWIKEHTDANGNPEAYLVFNRKAPVFLVGAGVLLAAYLFAIKGRKIIADENELTINDKEKISYGSIQKINKTHFKNKGFLKDFLKVNR